MNKNDGGFHPAMRKIRDDRAWSGIARIKPTPQVLAEQEQLRAAAEQERLRAVEILSKTEMKVGGTLITLDKATGVLSCVAHPGDGDCGHIRRLLEVARLVRRPRSEA